MNAPTNSDKKESAAVTEAIKLYINSEISDRIQKEVAHQIDLSWRPVGRFVQIAIPAVRAFVYVLPAIAWAGAVTIGSTAGLFLYSNIKFSYLEDDVKRHAQDTAKNFVEGSIREKEGRYAEIIGRLTADSDRISRILDHYNQKLEIFEEVIRKSGILKRNTEEADALINALKKQISTGEIARSNRALLNSANEIAKLAVERYIDKDTVVGWALPSAFSYVSISEKCFEAFEPSVTVAVNINEISKDSNSDIVTAYIEGADEYLKDGWITLTLCSK